MPLRTNRWRPPGGNGLREALAGLVEQVLHDPETGFWVLRMSLRGQWDLVTADCAAAWITASECVQGRGIWVSDRIHGVQFKAAYLCAAPPTTLQGIERYLRLGLHGHRPSPRRRRPIRPLPPLTGS